MSAGCAEDMREGPFSTKAVFAVAVTAVLKGKKPMKPPQIAKGSITCERADAWWRFAPLRSTPAFEILQVQCHRGTLHRKHVLDLKTAAPLAPMRAILRKGSNMFPAVSR